MRFSYLMGDALIFIKISIQESSNNIAAVKQQEQTPGKKRAGDMAESSISHPYRIHLANSEFAFRHTCLYTMCIMEIGEFIFASITLDIIYNITAY